MKVYHQNPDTAGRVVDATAFVITPRDNRLHTLNRAASEIWTLAREGCTLEQAATHLTTLYEVKLDRARADVEQCCRDLVQRGILIESTNAGE